ncbi:hypothetical protein [Crateriforma conspicua]|uniref:Uncharacterized protein n=1 Tax=Crateriforma conspicua TaxID=2527996 RepID=A0A5C5Y8S5_9PLAN|nr:hypothetical protein [Crateriforma conspicua]TWT71223.1 hypothetical protein Pan14r_35330 [Crateriforma conspicua]
MKRSIKKLFVLTVTAAITVAGTPAAEACGGGGFSSSRLGSFRGRGFATGAPPVMTRRQQVARHQATYSTHPATTNHYPAPNSYAAPATYNAQTTYPQSSGVSTIRPAVPQGIPATQSITQSRIATPAAAAPSATSIAPVQPNVNSTSVPTTPAPVQKQVATNQPTPKVVPATQQPATQQPATQQPATQQPTTQNSSAEPKTSVNAQQSALQILASLSATESKPAETATPSPRTAPAQEQPAATIPEFSSAAASESPAGGAEVGTWSVNLSGNQSVRLTLDDDGKFVWTATRGGKTNSFQGQYRLQDNQLTLVRANDLQQMQGTWVGGGDEFTFTLDGANNGGLKFNRAS